MIARDQGCALCRAHYSLCEAHHIIPWESPARGPTDIDNGALVCTDCHHWLHEHDLILVRDPNTGTWTTRPAQPHEIVPKRKPAEPEPAPSGDVPEPRDQAPTAQSG
ncbi:MAG: HNH endonuclease [Acidimicrobiia bacterium]|nr:HNH endonuclease [Acidimicrobiia bacterium]